MAYMVHQTIAKQFGGQVVADEIGLPVEGQNINFPAGATARWSK